MILRVFVVGNRFRKLEEGLESFSGLRKGHFQVAFGCFGVFPHRGTRFLHILRKKSAKDRYS